MRLLIRYTESRGVGQENWQSLYDGEIAFIGRGTDQTIALPGRRVPLEHSKLTLKGGELRLAAVGDHRFTVNDKVSKNSGLVPGDRVSIVGHTLHVLPGEEGADYVIEVDQGSGDVEPLRDRFTTRLWQLTIPERSVSWILFLGILAVGLIIPATGLITGMEPLRQSPLPDDSIWLAGELHETHAFMGEECSYCHTEPFTRAKEEDCLYCHLSVKHHFDTDKLGRDYKVGDRCADCHREHTASGQIVRQDQHVCTVCHRDLEAMGYDGDRLRPVTDFDSDHPPFRLSLLVWVEDEQSRKIRRVDPWEEGLQDASNLTFPHELHMKPEGIEAPDGTSVMSCGDCHVRDSGELNMKPVTMEQHCADCHQLTFDPATPDRVVPHGSPPDLMTTLREYYAWQFLDREAVSTSDVAPDQRRPARRPGADTRRANIAELMKQSGTNDALAVSRRGRRFIETKVADAADNLFERQTCVICHDITKTQDGDVPWRVQPVTITQDWYPLARFSHERHKNMQCDGCHDAESSADATDILMPDIGTCRACHGGERSEGVLQSNCVSCHEFHLESQGPMGELVAIEDLEEEEGEQ